MTSTIFGALAGWKRTPTEHGIVLSVQLAPSAKALKSGDFAQVSMAMNDRQLRSLSRDLARASRERGLDLFARRRWWQV